MDGNGKLKPFRIWKEEVASIASHFVGPWLQTEYNTAVIRAHNAADWLNFERNKDIFPNLRWMPTTSPNPEESHRLFWERKVTRPINDPFWNKHRPGDRWNCKCTLEATDDPITDIPGETNKERPQPGLKENPAKTKQIFDKSHPYFQKDCSTCPFAKSSKLQNLFTWFDNQKRNCYNCKFSKGCLDLANNDGFVLKNKYKNGGKLLIHPNVDKDKGDYHPMVVIGQHFAKQGKTVKLTPRVHIKDPEYKRIYSGLLGTKYEGKCPDLQIGNKHYEFESFSKPWKKNKVKRMLTNGVVQSQYIIIDNSKGASDRYIRKCIMAKKRLSTIEEVWIYEKGKIRPFFLVDKFI